MNYRDTIYEESLSAVNDWFAVQSREPFNAYYLYFTPSTENVGGAISIELDKPNDNWQLARAERISPMWTKQKALDFVYSTAMKLPLLPYGE
jgi:hypothetical protein